MDADGSNLVRLSAGGQNKSEPSWSPDATRIVYVSDGVLPLGNTEIYVANVDGTGVQRLTNYDGRDDFPAWSPDGTKVLFTRGVTFRAQDVFTADTDGSHLAKLTQTAAQLEITDALADQPRAGRAWAIVVLVDDARGPPRRERNAHLPRQRSQGRRSSRRAAPPATGSSVARGASRPRRRASCCRAPRASASGPSAPSCRSR
jgi:dipeptidyl aminopeptidase/acylaminoacyl peptidase